MSTRNALRNRRPNALSGLERLEDRTTPASGSGLLAQYYDNPGLTNLTDVRTDPVVDAALEQQERIGEEFLSAQKVAPDGDPTGRTGRRPRGRAC